MYYIQIFFELVSTRNAADQYDSRLRVRWRTIQLICAFIFYFLRFHALKGLHYTIIK